MQDGQNPKEQRRSDLEQALIDERAERASAQRRAAELTASVRTWRQRAEDRADRIKRLESERDHLRTARGFLTSRLRSARGGSVAAPASIDEPPDGDPIMARRAPSHPVVLIASNASGALRRVLGEARTEPFGTRPLDAYDLVVLDPANASDEELAEVEAWMKVAPRAPLVAVSGGASQWQSAEVALCNDACPDPCPVVGHLRLPEPIDPSEDSMVRGWALEEVSALDMPAEALVTGVDGGIVGVAAPLDDRSPSGLVSLAAGGFPVAHDLEPRMPDQAGARASRWAWRERDPAVLLEQLLDRAGVPYPVRDRTVGCLLISNRPEMVASAIAGIAAQTYDAVELVVGCHGFDPNVDALREAAGTVPIQVIPYAEAMTLGACLNDAAGQTSAPVLAKIDDDDYYAPEYLAEAMHWLRMTGGSIVGKYSHFVYFEPDDTTYLRRSEGESSLVSGIVPGATLVFRREVWQAVGFPERPRKVDFFFIEGARAAGFDVYSSSRWNWIHRRHQKGHTWETDFTSLLEGADEAWQGWQPERVRA